MIQAGTSVRTRFGRWLTLTAVLLLCAAALAQGGKRLILKDGNFQAVREYKMDGDRVRYLSAERGEWEEVPASLVDWKATEEWNKPKTSPALRKFSEEEEAERREMMAQTPSIAPGIRLPVEGGVWVLDEVNGRPKALELVQSGSELNKNTAGNILRAAINPLAGSKQTFELKGSHAALQVHTPAPEIYINIDSDGFTSKLDPSDRFRIVRLETTRRETRVLAASKTTFYGKVSHQENVVGSRAEKFSGNWVKLIPLDAMEPGEYAVVEMLSAQEMNLYVWDFGYEQ